MRKQRPYDLFRGGRRIALVLCCWLCQCVQTYVSPYHPPPTGYLVVEGFISANMPTQFTLSRTIELPGDSMIPVVTGAMVRVEGSDSSVYPLPDQGNGAYGGATLSLNPAIQYRLRINTPNGENYLSDFVPFKPTPPIDSITWNFSATNGVNIFVNTHDPNSSTHYYRWSYDQTWEYDMPQESYFWYNAAKDSVVPRLAIDNQFVYRCWTDAPSTDLFIDNTNKLSQDLVSEYPLVNIPNNTVQLGVLYSIQVTQYALTSDAYNFLLQMQANTQSLGSLFDVQPTQVIGNIHCLNNPSEQVIGYIYAGTAQQKRIFIAEDQLPEWSYFIACPGPNFFVPNIPDSLRYYFLSGFTPVSQGIGGWYSNSSLCVDCTLRGGSNIKPSFWPN